MTTSTTSTNVRFTVDFLNKKIVGTKASFNKASKGVSPIYEELTEKMAAHPTFTLCVKEQKKHSAKAKRTYEGLDFTFMEAYINIQPNKAQIMAEYVAVKAAAETFGLGLYPTMKKWFLGEFDPDHKGFDMAEAKKEIGENIFAEAVLNAAPAEDEAETVKAAA